MPLRTKRLFALGELSCGHRARTGPPLGVESQSSCDRMGPGSLCFPDGPERGRWARDGEGPREHPSVSHRQPVASGFFKAEGPSAPQLNSLLGGLGS